MLSALFWLSWIRILIVIVDPDQWKLSNINKELWCPGVQKGCCTFVGMFLDLCPALSIYFSCKNFVLTFKSDQDADPHEFAFVWLPGSGSESGSACESRSGSALKPTRIHNTTDRVAIKITRKSFSYTFHLQ